MSRKVYTYTNLKNIVNSRDFQELMKYPQITATTDLKKSLVGNPAYDKVEGLVKDNPSFKVTNFREIISSIDKEWNTDQSKFLDMIYLSEFIREQISISVGDEERVNWLTGCLRNVDSLLASIYLLEQADVKQDDINPGNDRNLDLMINAWKMLIERDPEFMIFRNHMNNLADKKAWDDVFMSNFAIESAESVDSIVFHGFYYITPIQEWIMRQMEKSGFNLIYLIPYDERYPFEYEIWDKTYSVENGFAPKSEWNIEKTEESDPYGEIFDGKKAQIDNKLELKEYASIIEFVNDVKHIKENHFSLYSADFSTANQLLKDYYPEEYGERKFLSYPIGQFINTLNNMWDSEENTIALDEDLLIECFSSGWLALNGESGRKYLKELIYVLPFFTGCHTISDWKKRILLFKQIKESVIAPFEVENDMDSSVSRWQEAIGSPLKNFGMFSVASEELDKILKLIEQILGMAEELFGNNDLVVVHDHIHKMDLMLKKQEISKELYSEERSIVDDIFEKLGADNSFNAMCHPSDIARALDLFMNGRYEDGEIITDGTGLVYPLYFVEAACVKNKGKVHICLSDVNSLPGGKKDYIWPLTRKKIYELYEKTGNALLSNLMYVIEVAPICNRYFTYIAMKNDEVTISWISTINDKNLAPSPYIKLLESATGITITPPARYLITEDRVNVIPAGQGPIMEYDRRTTHNEIIKEARMDYALCPMRYVLGYVH